MSRFNYDTAFSRNIGWVTENEQQLLRNKRIAIAGLGGVGGRHLLTLTRMGIGAFKVSDFDEFDIANLNRQLGANMTSIGRKKIDVLSEMALAINPEIEIKQYPTGVTTENIDEFLTGADLYVDGLDFFVIDIREKIFAACAEKGIPALTAAPLGMGTAFLAFIPGQMTFEDYFQLKGHSKEEKLLRFLVGLSPAMLQKSYLADPSAVNFQQQRGPSTPMACDLCAGLLGSMAVKILLGRGKLPVAPHGLQFDAYRNKLTRTWRPGGMRNPLLLGVLKIVKTKLSL